MRNLKLATLLFLLSRLQTLTITAQTTFKYPATHELEKYFSDKAEVLREKLYDMALSIVSISYSVFCIRSNSR